MTKDPGEIHLTSNLPRGLNINITLDGETYHVQTEGGGTRNPLLTTHIYYGGEVVYAKKTDYSDIVNSADFAKKLGELAEMQSKATIEEFTKRHGENKKKSDYFDAVKKLLMRKNNKQALRILEDALQDLPEDPFIMSYYGYLRAIVEKKYEEGIEICKKVLEGFDPDTSSEEKFLYAEFYLNLGRSYLAAGDRRSAIDAFTDGLRLSKNNHDLLWELKKLGTRRRPVISFLQRGNPINKFLGFLFSRLKGK